MKLRLTARIVLVFLLLATVLLAVVGVLSYLSGSKSLKDAAVSDMLGNAIEKEAALDAWIEERSSDIRQIAERTDLVEKAARLIAAAPKTEEARSAHALLLEELHPYLTGDRPNYKEVFVMEPEGGKVVASTRPTQEGKSELGHPYFENGKTRFCVEGPYQSADLLAPALTAAIPLRATNGRVVAVLAARLDLAIMTSIAQRRRGLRETEDAFLFNAEQFPVTQPRFLSEQAVLGRKLDTEAVRCCVARNSGVTLAPDYRGVPSIAVYRWNAKRQLGLIVKIDQAEALAPARAFGRSVVLISGLALLGTVGLALLLARTITRPLRALHEGVRRFADGDMRKPLLESFHDEVGLLAREFNVMAARVAERTADLARVNEALKAENAERKRAELETQHQAAFARFNPNPVLELSAAGEIAYLNQAAREMASALGLENPAQMLPPGAAAMARECLTTGKPRLRVETRIGPRVFSWSFFPVKFNHTVHCYAGDITEHKRGEESLRASQQLIEGIINAIPVRVFWKDKNLVYLGCNAVFARDAGFADPKDLIGKDDYQMGWRDQAELYRAGDRQVIESGCPRPLVEEPQTTPEGNTITLLTSKIPLRDSKGEVSGMIGSSMDVTDRRQAEEALRESEDRYRSLVEDSPDAIGIYQDGNLVFINCTGTQLLGARTKEELLGRKGEQIVHPDDHPNAADRLRRRLAGETGMYPTEVRYVRLDGTIVPVEVAATPITFGGKPAVQFLARDITERKQAEEELRRISELLRRTGELAKVGGWELDLRTMKLFWSLETGRIHEADPPVAPALDQAVNFYAPEARPVIQAAVQAAIDTGAPFDLDLPLTTAKGRSLWVRAQGSAVMEDGKAVKLIGAFQDITERRQAEASLRRSEAKFRILYDSTSDAVMLSDQKGFFDCNQATLAMFGCATREEFCSKHPADVSPPVQPDGTDSLRLAKQHIATAMEKGSFQFEWMHKRDDTGETFPAEVLLCALELDGKRVLQGSVRDITERKQSEASLRLQGAALAAAANGIAITDLKGSIQWVNPAFSQLTGYSREEAIGQNPRVLKSGQHSESFYKELWQTISAGHVWKGEIVNRRKDGHLYDEEMTITPVQDRAGQVSHFVAVKQDISQRKHAEKALRERQFLLSESQRLGHVGSWFYDLAGPMMFSEEMYRTFGVSPDSFTPSVESLLGLIHPEDRVAMQAWIAACAAGEKPRPLEFRILLPDGSIRFIRGDGQAVHDGEHRLTHMAGTALDITERKAAETELAELHKQLVDASREAGMAEIATNVLHNVGNVLNSVNVSTGLVVESVKKSRASSLARVVGLLQEHAQDLGAFITQDSRGKHVPAHLAQLAEHLQTEQEANVRELEALRRNVEHIKAIVAMQQNYASFGGVKEMVNVVNLVEDSLRLNDGAFIRHEVEVIREFGQVPLLNVEKHKILQILVNLLRNAKYACDESRRGDKRLTVRVANGEGRVRISVIDNGVGIPPENLTRIFNHGFTTRKQGHGFGLHSGALAAKEMGGSLTAHSDGPGQGASFTLELPLFDAGEAHD